MIPRRILPGPTTGAASRILLASVSLAASLALGAAEKPAPRGQPIRPVTTPVAPAAPTSGTNAPSPSAAAPVASGSTNAAGVAIVGFDVLSTFKYEVPEDATAGAKPAAVATDPDAQIPATVKAYNGRRIALKGFMLPLKVEGGLVTELLLMRDQSMCCFGTVPKINEWVAVKMTGGGVKPVMDQAVTLSGKIKIGAMRENGYLVGIYQMDGDRMDAPGLVLQ